jgi:hypothetical protein
MPPVPLVLLAAPPMPAPPMPAPPVPACPLEDPFVEALEVVLLDACAAPLDVEGPAPAPRCPALLQPTNKAAMGAVKAAIRSVRRFMWSA